MILLVGLGNPGITYENTWHNLGFRVIDLLSERYREVFGHWGFKKKYNARASEGKISSKKILLVKPDTFMNDSGKSVALLSRYYKVGSRNIWIIHDDIDLPMHRLKISRDVSSGGHKGVQSIIDSLDTQAFVRFRLGIDPQTPKKIPTEKYVLQKIPSRYKTEVKNFMQYTLEAVKYSLKRGVENAMNKYNKK